MKTKLLSISLAIFLCISLCAPAALAATTSVDDINNLWTSLSSYIKDNQDVIGKKLSENDDFVCGYAVELAQRVLGQDEENIDLSYDLLYSVYSYLMLIVNDDTAKSDAKEIYSRVAKDFLTDEYFSTVNPDADRKSIEALVAKKDYANLYAPLREAVYNQLSSSGIKAENLLPTQDATTEELPFEDVTTDDWFYGAVEYAYTMQLFNGTSETQFSPNLTMTHAMFITVLYRFAGSPSLEAVKENTEFSDVVKGSYYADAVTWADSEKLISWAKNNTFSPESAVTREEMIYAMYMYAKSSDKLSDVAGSLEGITDTALISGFAKDAMSWAYATGLIKGSGDGSVNPLGIATRAEVAQVFLNYFAVLAMAEQE